MTNHFVTISSHIETSLWIYAFVAIFIVHEIGTHDDTVFLTYLGTHLSHEWSRSNLIIIHTISKALYLIFVRCDGERCIPLEIPGLDRSCVNGNLNTLILDFTRIDHLVDVTGGTRY